MAKRGAKLWAVAVLTLSALVSPHLISRAVETASVPEMQRSSQTQRSSRARSASPKSANYAKFSHNVEQHKRACDSCHKFPTSNWKTVRQGDAAFPDVTDYPKHDSCLDCHRQQFFRGAQPAICSICHVNPSPRDSRRHPFPNPPEIFDVSPEALGMVSEFGISFPHDKHVDIVGQLQPGLGGERGLHFRKVSFQQKSEQKNEQKAEESDPKSCAFCHKTYQPQGESDDEYVTKPPKDLPDEAFWLKKGTFKTSPNHATCFTCHTEEGMTPTSKDCNICHKLLPPDQARLTQAHDDFDPKMAAAMHITDKLTLELWSKRDTAKFRHEWAPHASLKCTDCHVVATLNTLDKKTIVQVRSCGGEGSGCHIEATNEGILNEEVGKKKASASFTCTKCHVLNGQKPVPNSHLQAVAAAKPK